MKKRQTFSPNIPLAPKHNRFYHNRFSYNLLQLVFSKSVIAQNPPNQFLVPLLSELVQRKRFHEIGFFFLILGTFSSTSYFFYFFLIPFIFFTHVSEIYSHPFLILLSRSPLSPLSISNKSYFYLNPIKMQATLFHPHLI